MISREIAALSRLYNQINPLIIVLYSVFLTYLSRLLSTLLVYLEYKDK